MKPDVWMISSSFYPHLGGGEQQAFRLSKKLIEKGWDVHVLTRRHNPRYAYFPAKFEIHEGVPIHRLFCPGPGKIGSILFLISSLLFLFIHGRKGIYHAHGIGTPATIAVIAAQLFDGKSLVKLRTGVDLYSDIMHSRYDRGLGFQIDKADYLVAVNKAVREKLHQWGVPNARILFLPNAVDSDKFSPCAGQLAKKEQFIPSEFSWKRRTLFLCIGRLVKDKGVDVLLTAWANLPEKMRTNSLLLIVGGGSEKGELIAQANGLEIMSSIIFFGRREEVLDFYHASDIVVLPSRIEGLSNVMLEAMACGLPIICTEVGGAVEWIQSGKNGKLVPPEDVKALSGALQWIWENEEKWAELGMNARETILRSLTMDVLVEKLEKVYLS